MGRSDGLSFYYAQKENTMTERMQRFCEAYLANGKTNAAQAYRDAGYKAATDKTAWSSGNKLLRNAEVQEYLSNHAENLKIQAEHEERLMTAEELCLELCKIAKDGREKTNDRLHAMELYGKTLNLFNTSNVNVNTAPIVIIDDLDG